MPKPQEADDKRQAAREVIDILQEISDLLVRVFVL
jgi:mitotic-spindle organizing protein 1